MKPPEVLQAARAKVAQGWCQGHHAEFPNGEATSFPKTPGVCRWCMLGAIDAVTPGMDTANIEATYLLQKAAAHLEGMSVHVASWNDAKGRTKEQVLQAYDLAIKLSEAEE